MFIGEKEIKNTETSEQKTEGGGEIIKVEYVDGTVEFLPKLMYDKVVTEQSIDLSQLREKRVQPIVQSILFILREWGIKTGETSYFSALLNQSLNNNIEQATIMLWGQFMPKPKSLDDVDLLTVDRVLREFDKKTLKEIIGKP